MYLSFETKIAEEYGIKEAIMINCIRHWILKHKAEEKNFFDGHYWTYNTIKGWSDLFKFWTPKQIRSILDSLIEKGVLQKGNYNQTPYDRTSWYSFVDENLWLDENGDFHLPKKANEIAQNGKPIPDIIPNNNNIKNNIINNIKKNPCEMFQEKWNGFCSQVKGNTSKCMILTDKRKRQMQELFKQSELLRQQKCPDKELIRFIMEDIIFPAWSNSSFLQGKIKSDKHPDQFKFDIDYVLNPKYFAQMIERNLNN